LASEEAVAAAPTTVSTMEEAVAAAPTPPVSNVSVSVAIPPPISVITDLTPHVPAGPATLAAVVLADVVSMAVDTRRPSDVLEFMVDTQAPASVIEMMVDTQETPNVLEKMVDTRSTPKTPDKGRVEMPPPPPPPPKRTPTAARAPPPCGDGFLEKEAGREAANVSGRKEDNQQVISLELRYALPR
jgi:hypothetical protein